MTATRIVDRSVITADPVTDWKTYADQCGTVADQIEAEVGLVGGSLPLLYLRQEAGASGVGTLADPIRISTTPATAWTDLLSRLSSLEGTYTSGFQLQFLGGDGINIRRNGTAYTPGIANVHWLMRDPDDGTRAYLAGWQPLSDVSTASPTLSGSWTDNGDGSWTIALTGGTTVSDIMVGAQIDDIEDDRYWGQDVVLLALDTATGQAIAAQNCNHAATNPTNALRIWTRGATNPWEMDWYICPTYTTPIIASPTDGFALVGGNLGNGSYGTGGAETYILRVSGNVQAVVKDCFLGSTRKHTVGIAGGPNDGAQLLVRNCDTVAGPADSASFSAFVNYTISATASGDEPDLLVMDTKVRGHARGQFSGTSQYRAISSVFCHTGSGTVGSTIAVRVDQKSAGFGGSLGVLKGDDLDAGHLYAEVGCKQSNSPYGASSERNVMVQPMTGTIPFSGGHYSVVYQAFCPQIAIGSWEPITSVAARHHSNNLFEVTIPDLSGDASNTRPFMWGPAGASIGTMEMLGYNNTFVLHRETAGTDFAWFHINGTFAAGKKCQQFESLFTGDGAAYTDHAVERNNDLNADAASADIGLRNCAFWGVTSGSYTSSGAPVVLSAEPDYTARPALDDDLVLEDDDVPEARDLPVDRAGNRRSATYPTIGSLGALLPTGGLRSRDRSRAR